MSDDQQFVIKVTSATGGATMWLGASVGGGPRVFGAREIAEVFGTQSQAQAVIEQMPLAFDRAGFAFLAEPAD